MTTPTEAPSNIGHAADEREGSVRQYVDQRRVLHGHIGGFATGMLIMFAVNLVINISAGTAGKWNAWWSVWALLGWSIGLAVHGFVVWLNRPSFASSTAEELDALTVIDRFHRAMGQPQVSLPDPVDDRPARVRPDDVRDIGARVSQRTGPTRSNVGRALSLMPARSRSWLELVDTNYAHGAELTNLR